MQPEEVRAMAKLSKSEVSERLKKLKGWRLDADTIKKEYQFVISQGDQIH